MNYFNHQAMLIKKNIPLLGYWFVKLLHQQGGKKDKIISYKGGDVEYISSELDMSLDHGGVCINHSTLHYSNNNLPFGGINNSGTGRCHGIYGFHELSNKKSILKQILPSSPTDFLFPPYNNFKNKLIEFTIKWL